MLVVASSCLMGRSRGTKVRSSSVEERRRGAAFSSPGLNGRTSTGTNVRGIIEHLEVRRYRVGGGGRVRGCPPSRGRRARGRGGRRRHPREAGGACGRIRGTRGARRATALRARLPLFRSSLVARLHV